MCALRYAAFLSREILVPTSSESSISSIIATAELCTSDRAASTVGNGRISLASGVFFIASPTSTACRFSVSCVMGIRGKSKIYANYRPINKAVNKIVLKRTAGRKKVAKFLGKGSMCS